MGKFGGDPLSMRVRVGRNLTSFPLPGSMTKQDRCEMEEQLIPCFDKLIEMPEYGGKYVSITPGTRHSIPEEEYQQLVDDHIMFKDMAADTYLTAAGIASDWPHGRGCYISGLPPLLYSAVTLCRRIMPPQSTLPSRCDSSLLHYSQMTGKRLCGSARRTTCGSCACRRARSSTRSSTGCRN